MGGIVVGERHICSSSSEGGAKPLNYCYNGLYQERRAFLVLIQYRFPVVVID